MKIFRTALVASGLLLLAAFILCGVFGYYVKSGSMEPSLPVASQAIAWPQSSYQEGDIVAFQDEGSMVIHRIVGTGPEGFTTKGDANSLEDTSPIAEPAIKGKVIFHSENWFFLRLDRWTHLADSHLAVSVGGGDRHGYGQKARQKKAQRQCHHTPS